MQYDKKLHLEVLARAAGVVLLDGENRILLVHEKGEGKKGFWHIPSGSVKIDELLEEAAIREAKEETGLDVRLEAYLDTFVGKFPDGELVLRHVWIAEYDKEQNLIPVLSDEIAEARFFSQVEFDELYENGELRMYHTKLIFDKAIQYRLRRG